MIKSGRKKEESAPIIEKGEFIIKILELIRKSTGGHLKQVLKNKSNLSQNEYLMKNESFLTHCMIIGRTLNNSLL